MATVIDRLFSLVTPPNEPLPEPRYADGQGIFINDLEAAPGDFTAGIFLKDANMPEQGMVVGGELRSVVTRYPGTSKTSVQIMGTEESDIEIRGWLRDVWTGLDGGAADMFGQMRALWLAQHYCELSWGELIVRRGYIKRVEATITSERAIQYKLVFQVTEADEAKIIATKFPKAETPFELLALIEKIQSRIGTDFAGLAVLINNVARAVI